MNEQSMYTGFIKENATLKHFKDGTQIAYFTLVINSGKGFGETNIPCVILGDNAEKISLMAIRGSLVSVIGNYKGIGLEYKGIAVNQLVIEQVEIHISSKVGNGIGIKEFIELYAPQSVIDRRVKKEKKRRGRPSQRG